jgi:XTP/dITP diphosphohydrolase
MTATIPSTPAVDTCVNIDQCVKQTPSAHDYTAWPSTVVLASNNPGKLKEFQTLLNTFSSSASGGQQPVTSPSQPLPPIQLVSQSTLGVSEAQEPHCTFIENALAKARHAARLTGLPALADDSGLCVPALQGVPGVYSARFASLASLPDRERWGFPTRISTDAANALRLLEALAPHDNRRAYYFCALAFVLHADDPEPLISCARWWGEISHTPAGSQGFGYDAIFYIPDLDQTAAQLDAQTKNQHSHRAQAFTQWITALHERFSLIQGTPIARPLI